MAGKKKKAFKHAMWWHTSKQKLGLWPERNSITTPTKHSSPFSSLINVYEVGGLSKKMQNLLAEALFTHKRLTQMVGQSLRSGNAPCSCSLSEEHFVVRAARPTCARARLWVWSPWKSCAALVWFIWFLARRVSLDNACTWQLLTGLHREGLSAPGAQPSEQLSPKMC